MGLKSIMGLFIWIVIQFAPYMGLKRTDDEFSAVAEYICPIHGA